MGCLECTARLKRVGSHKDRYRGQLPMTTHRQLGYTCGDACSRGFLAQHLTTLASDPSIKKTNLQLGVPQRVVVNDSSPMILARPKSASLIDRFLSVNRMFSGLMSRCTTFRSCRYFVPWKSCMKIFRVSFFGQLLLGDNPVE